MLKEFIEHIQKTTQPLITNVNGSAFCVTSDGNIEELLPTIFHPYKHVVPGHSTEAASNHSHGVRQFDSNIAEALKGGDKVVLLRNYGGQEYLILGRR